MSGTEPTLDEMQLAPLLRFAWANCLTDESVDVAAILMRGGEASVARFIRGLREALEDAGISAS